MASPMPGAGADGNFTLNSVSLFNPGWDLLNIRTLWFPGAFRGKSVTVPYVEGGVLRRRRLTLSTYTLKMAFHGEYDRLGAASATPRITLQANLDYFYANVVVPAMAGVTGVLTMPSGATRTSSVVSLSWREGDALEDVQEMSLQIEVSGRMGFGS